MRFDNASIVVYYCLIQMNIINLGILAHIDAGKTSVTENLLFASGATEKCGRVDNGDTITDSMDIEKRRGITVRASTTSIIWNGVKCNIIDTPGHMDFIAEVERTFKMLDGAVLILSAKEGIQAQTKLLFSTLQKLQIPTIIFINKIDRDGVNLERLYLDIKTNLSQDVLFMQTVVDGLVYPICSQTYIKEEGSVVILGGLSLVNSLHAYTFASLKRKKLISTTPLNDALNALILALNASAAAFVLLFTKKFRILS